MRRLACTLLVALAAPTALAAEGDTSEVTLPKDVVERLDAVMNPGVVGEVLATEALGDAELKPVRPGSLTSVVTALQAFNKDGKLAPGAAVEVTPWALGAGAGMSYQDYVSAKSWLKRNLLRSSLSLATVGEGEGDATTVRAAAGLRLRLWDDSDWRTSEAFVQCAVDIPKTLPGAIPEPPADGPPGGGVEGVVPAPPASEDYLKAFDKCLAEKGPKWNASQGALGLTATLRAPGGDLKQAEADRLEAVLGTTIGLGDASQLIASARLSRTFPRPATDTAEALPARTLVGVGARWVYKADRFIINVNTGLGHEHTHADRYFKGLTGLLLQLRVGTETWVESNIDATWVGGGAPNELTFGTNLKWAYDLTPKKL